MRKLSVFCAMLVLVTLCGCEELKEETRFLLDTVANIKADCNGETLSGAFELCENLEKTLSRTKENSDVWRINNSEGFTEVSESTKEIVERSLYYSEISGGKFDITVYAVSSLWDFKNQVIPDRNEIAAALKNIDYQSIEIVENKINTNGSQIDLGGIAKGYIADKTKEYLTQNGAKKGLINLGGDIVTFGETYKIAIEKPFEGTNASILKIKNKAVVTSGIYQRYIEENGKIYHHIIDPETGYGAENDLASVTVIGESALDCDALATVCMLLGLESAIDLVESTDYEAVFINREGEILLTSGVYEKGGYLNIK